MEFKLPPEQCFEFGPGPDGRLTWRSLEMICEMLRKHGRIEIHCGFQAYAADLITDIGAGMKMEK